MKKIMTVLAAAAVALTLVGCAKLGDVQTSGTKWKKTFKLDATGEIKDADGNAATYCRGFAALSASKKCSEIETVITLPMTDGKNITINTELQKSVVGLAFDVSLVEKEDGKKYYDFVLVGVKPADGGYYIEHYYDVPQEALKESMNTTDGTMGGQYEAVSGAEETGGWAGTIIPYEDASKVATDGYKWTVKVTQETAGTYKVFINDVHKGTYTRTLTEAEAASKNGKAYGQIFMYGNSPAGTKIEAVFTSDKDNTVGLFADEEEF